MAVGETNFNKQKGKKKKVIWPRFKILELD